MKQVSSLRRLGCFAMAIVAVAGCRHAPKPDAYGNVEATEIVVASQASGQLQAFTDRKSVV